MSHAVVGLALGSLTRVPRRRRIFWVLSALLPVVPDLDVIGLAFGIRFHSMWGHRGISHSLVGALVIGLVAAALTRRAIGMRFLPLALYAAAVTASHGVLDALTTGGPGVAFFAPFDETRYFAPWRLIPVSPLAPQFFSEWGWRVFRAELVLLWLPAAAVILTRWIARARR
ncbi:MAG TPA: metal-dependent hydrolase [Terriglobales bacterium]|nr:metal-dependent hydrolase [Terriglobales bacterium]